MRPTVGRLPAQIVAICARLPGSNSERSRKPRGGWQQCSSTLAQHRAPQTDYVCGICSPVAPHSDCAPVFTPTRPTFHWQMQQRHDQWQCRHCRVSLMVPLYLLHSSTWQQRPHGRKLTLSNDLGGLVWDEDNSICDQEGAASLVQKDNLHIRPNPSSCSACTSIVRGVVRC